MNDFKCVIPATCANLGLGFDSIGIAIEKFMTVEASLNNEFTIEYNENLEFELPRDKNNLILKTAINIAQKFNKELPAFKVTISNDIPLTRGLGSSSSAIVAGIELANHFANLQLSDDDKLNLGCSIERHPDNIGPCITGGLFVGAYINDKLFYKQFLLDDVYCILTIPDYPLKTETLRTVLPNEYNRETAVLENALGNVLVSALITKDYELMGKLMMKDMYHEPYRSPLIKEYNRTKKVALKAGAYSTTISGAGPTILTLVGKSNHKTVYTQLSKEVNCHHEIVKVYNPSNFK